MPSSKLVTNGYPEFEHCKRTGKICYENRASAIGAWRHLRKSQGGLIPFRCRYCGRWHLGQKLPEVSPDSSSSSKLIRRQRAGDKRRGRGRKRDN